MNPEIRQYILSQSPDRQPILENIHSIITNEDSTVIPVLEPMMGKQMIIYKDRSSMKYALSSVKNHISLHVLPIYGSPALHSKYQALLPKASFQKGCINFNSAEELPFDIVKQLFSECAKIDLVKMREEQLKARKQEKKARK